MKHPEFDYSQLPASQAQWLKNEARQISTTLRHNAASVINIGKRLIEVREILGPHVFKLWCSTEFEWSYITANKYIACAKRFGDSDCAWVIQSSALIALVKRSVPESAIAEVMKLARSKQTISFTMVQEVISRHMLTQLPAIPAAPQRCLRTRELMNAKSRIQRAVRKFQEHYAAIATHVLTADERQALAAKLESVAAVLSDGGEMLHDFDPFSSDQSFNSNGET